MAQNSDKNPPSSPPSAATGQFHSDYPTDPGTGIAAPTSQPAVDATVDFEARTEVLPGSATRSPGADDATCEVPPDAGGVSATADTCDMAAVAPNESTGNRTELRPQGAVTMPSANAPEA